MNVPRDTVVTQDDGKIDTFKVFWENYPRKQKKKDAEKSYKKSTSLHSFPAIEELIGIIAAWKQTKQWIEGYSPLASTWLNGECWEDVLPDEAESKQDRLNRLLEESR